ncbi:uncharacterized protein KY384_002155 [Bacidia gigantensis]|uniref:uncharacterized protein n=1 Tax=Bacidia gigantensis TaxID=2732470 RepID=UPI001D04C360|nr:uncharacterized protein KY384_002155 [Bacidia gigantensis]KAG8533372.1 hypothetical protein KY384_002155 [Bacidia gigantensis]
MWPSQTVFTPSVSSASWVDGAGQHNPTTSYQANSSQSAQTLPSLIPNLTTAFSDGSPFLVPPAGPSITASQRVLPLPDRYESTSEKPQATAIDHQPQPLRKRKRASQRRQYPARDWERHRSEIKKLYIDQDLPLEDVTKKMSSLHGFNPPVKKFKEKLNEWRFFKYVPKEVLQWMLHKAEQRSAADTQHPQGKRTLFEYGALVLTQDDVQKRSSRANLGTGENADLGAPTPQNVIYQTPGDMALSPPSARTPRQSRDTVPKWTPAPSPCQSQDQFFPSTFQNYTLTHFESMEREANRLEREEDVYAAEQRYREALAGLERILSATHKQTTALAYRLATFYANHDRMDDADRVLRWVTEKHVRRWGTVHENTMRHLLHVSKLYRIWSRSDEALSLLYRVLDTWDDKCQANVDREMPVQFGTTRHREPSIAVLGTNSERPGSRQAPQTLAEIVDPLRFDVQMSLSNTGLQAGDVSTEENLLHLIGECETHWQRLSLEILRARCTLINLYRKQNSLEKCSTALKEAWTAVHKSFEPGIEKTERLIRACLEVGKLHLECNDEEVAEDLFQSIAQNAEDAFQEDHAVIIRIFIHIGKLYQSQKHWFKAAPWFERALAASIAIGDSESPLIKVLEEALENHCYSSTCEQDMTITLDELRRIKFIL